MPRQRQTLQQQGVPIPDKLGPRRYVVKERTPLSGQMGGTRETVATYEDTSNTRNSRISRNSRSLRKLNPGSMGSESVSGVGLLEAEFIVAIALLILIMFHNSSSGFSTKVMSFMKRGSLTCLLFFILAMISTIGPNATRIAKAFGALVVIAILVTSPIVSIDKKTGDISGPIQDIDNLIKNDWVGTSEEGNDVAPSADTGTSQSTTHHGTVTLTQSEISKLVHAAIGSPAYNAFTAEIRAFKSGEVWKVPIDAVNALEQTGVHGIGKIWDELKGLLHLL